MLFNPNPFDIWIIKWNLSVSRHTQRCSSLFQQENRKRSNTKICIKAETYLWKNASVASPLCCWWTTNMHHTNNVKALFKGATQCQGRPAARLWGGPHIRKDSIGALLLVRYEKFCQLEMITQEKQRAAADLGKKGPTKGAANFCMSEKWACHEKKRSPVFEKNWQLTHGRWWLKRSPVFSRKNRVCRPSWRAPHFFLNRARWE